MHFTTSLATLVSLAALLTSLVSAGTSTYPLGVSEGEIVPRGGCQLEYTDNICTTGCFDIIPLTDSYTCQEIDEMVAAGTNGGNISALNTCGGTVNVEFFGDGKPSVTRRGY